MDSKEKNGRTISTGRVLMLEWLINSMKLCPRWAKPFSVLGKGIVLTKEEYRKERNQAIEWFRNNRHLRVTKKG